MDGLRGSRGASMLTLIRSFSTPYLLEIILVFTITDCSGPVDIRRDYGHEFVICIPTYMCSPLNVSLC